MQRKSKKISVVISVYKNDCSKLFDEAMKSIFSNSVLPYQVILIKDGATPSKIDEIIKKYYKKIILIQNKTNIGLAKSLNKALKVIKTDWIIRADADDINMTNRFESLLSEIEKNKYDVIGSYILENNLDSKIETIKKVPLSHKLIKKVIFYRNPINHMSVAIKTSQLRDVKGYPNIYLKEDYGLWIKLMINKAKFINVGKTLVKANINDNFYIRRSGFKLALSEIHIYVLLTKLNKFFKSYGLIILFVRMTFCLLPPIIKKFTYKILRLA
jgi:glycosyltransferase involved in cell wall biosynthesis